MITFSVNQRPVDVEADPDMPLLWVLRDLLAVDGHEIRLRGGAVRGVYGTPEWGGSAVLRDEGKPGVGAGSGDD